MGNVCAKVSFIIDGVSFPLELVTQKMGYRSHEVYCDFRTELFFKLFFNIITLTKINKIVYIESDE